MVQEAEAAEAAEKRHHAAEAEALEQIQVPGEAVIANIIAQQLEILEPR